MKTHYLRKRNSINALIQIIDPHELETMEDEICEIERRAETDDFDFIAVETDSWNTDLSPWEAPAVFGSEGFGAGARKTLEYIRENVVLPINTGGNKNIIVGGYSLAGLFALWAVCETDCFRGAAAVSPSVWFPGFTDYFRSKKVEAEKIYLSLGKREEKTRNQVMAKVGPSIREVYQALNEKKIKSVLEWNEGNHFTEPEIRTARGFSWLIGQKTGP